MSYTQQVWMWALLLPALTFLCQTMCLWRGPRFLGELALLLLNLSIVSFLVFLAALPAFVGFVASCVIFRNQDGQLPWRVSRALGCLCFVGLWFLANVGAISLRHQAFVRASRNGDRLVQALAQYHNRHEAYPDSLDRLVPRYLEEIPDTGLIAYPGFSYRKDRNDIQVVPGSYELRIDCTSGGINFDRFIYWPAESYPDRIQGNSVERIRKWAYVHE